LLGGHKGFAKGLDSISLAAFFVSSQIHFGEAAFAYLLFDFEILMESG
jgi:hypothetical protein